MEQNNVGNNFKPCKWSICESEIDTRPGLQDQMEHGHKVKYREFKCKKYLKVLDM